MRFLSYRVGHRESYGILTAAGVVDLSERLVEAPTLKALIETDRLDAARKIAATATADHQLDALALLPPIIAPEKIWCIGVNYAERNSEYRDGSALQSYPSLFARVPTSFVGHGQPIERPRVSEQLDYEGEIAFVIGRGGRHIERRKALSHIFGLTLCNEGTVRDWLRHGKFNNTQGKNFDRSGSMGPWVVTSDELDLNAPLELSTYVNGERRQHDSTSRLMFPFDMLIEYLSTFATLKPGDVIVSGTPTGAGARFDPPKWLRPGDVVEVCVPEIGVLRNSVIDEPIDPPSVSNT